ncbi:tetratricopeptide repeat protein [Celeribacter arenosi]|uniref:Ancillary SecYEG translocon subunit/Cell division coordinator CpoB TPR domain-containing protein n=1 Tax=Celeribacter arenosi TaxID=792649 RepID=A0ABP7KG48_9RHOB
MSNTDSFIDEVTEEVRRDRLFAMMRRYGWIAVVGVVGLVGLAAYNEYSKAQSEAAAQAAGDSIQAALESSEPESRAAALADARATIDSDARYLADFMRAGELFDVGDIDGAIAILTPMTTDAMLDPVYRDLALLKSTMIGASTMAPDVRIAKLASIAAAGAPYRLLAEEQIAAAQIEMGETEAAIGGLRAIISDAEVSDGLRRRALQMIVALGGDPDAG